MQQRILVTCGTSVIGRLSMFGTDRNRDGRPWGVLRELQKGRQEDQGKQFLEEDAVGQQLWQDFLDSRDWASAAEPRTLSDIAPAHPDVQLVLIHAENYASDLAARLLEEALARDGYTVRRRPVEGLTQHFTEFAAHGYPNLCTAVADELVSQSELQQPPVLCAVGGFNITIALTTVMAQLAGCPLIYRYDLADTDGKAETVQIPPLPVGVDHAKLTEMVEWMGRLSEGDAGPARMEATPLIQFFERMLDSQEAARHRPYLSSVPAGELPAEAWAAQQQLAQKDRVSRWVRDAELWLGDPLPQMVDHGIEHSRNVDRGAATLLLHAALQDGGYTAQMFEALTCAAWLHDVGHAGGPLFDHYVRPADYRHVRDTHGMLSRRIIDDRSDVFPDREDRELMVLVGLLCEHHQRFRPLTANEKPKQFKTCKDPGCALCPSVKAESTRSLEDELPQQLPDPDPDNIRLWLRVAAMLRVADAADIGAHRLRGRHTTGHHNWQKVWRREFAQDLLDRVRRAQVTSTPSTTASDELLERLADAVRSYRETPIADAPAIYDILKQLGLAAEGDWLADSLRFLENQAKHRQRHEAVLGARIHINDGPGFEIVFAMEPGPEDRRRAGATDVAAYVWGEYLGVADLMKEALLPLDAVRVFVGRAELEAFDEGQARANGWANDVD